MSNSGHENSPRERLARLIALMKRTRLFWKSAFAIAVIGLGVSFALAWVSKRAWRSEETVLYRQTIATDNKDGETAAARAAKLGPKLKDLLYARPRLEELVKEFNLYPEKQHRSMVEAVEEMQTNIGFKPRSSDAYDISFVTDDPNVAQQVTAKLAENVIEDYNAQNISSAVMTRDFLRRELDDANKEVDEASRQLAEFLAAHPQFTWGLNDSPYAVNQGAQSGSPMSAPRAATPQQKAAPVPTDPQLAWLDKELQRVEGELAPPVAPKPVGAVAPPANLAEAQKQRDDAAKQLATAKATLDERLATMTPAHPEVVSAQQRVETAKAQLAAAESNLKSIKAGDAAPSNEVNASLSPERRAELEKDRGSLRQQIQARRAALAGDTTAAPTAETPKVEQPKVAPPKVETTVDLETDWHRLRLELDRARDQLRTVQVNEHQADVAADAVEKRSQDEMQILEPAYRPTRPDKGKGRVFLLGAAITFFLALGYAATRVLLNDTLLDQGDIVALGGPRVIVEMPRMGVSPKRKSDAPRAIIPLQAPEPVPVAHGAPPRESGPRETHQPALRALPAAMVQPPPRRPQQTIRFGSPMPPSMSARGGTISADGMQVEEMPSSRSSAALMLAPVAQITPVRPVLDEPEVEVLGVDVDVADSEGAFGLLRGASADARSALRVLRHRLDQKRGLGSYVVSVMSPSSGEGKTTLAARLAITLAEAERARVVLVEGHFDRPRLASALGVKLPEIASFSAQIRAHRLGQGRPWGVVKLGTSLALLAEPHEEAAYPEAVHAAQFEDALDALRRTYDYVVIDGPSVLGTGDANVIEDVSDAVLLVARASATKGAELSRAATQIGERRILGVVLNDVLMAAPRTMKKSA